jgi:hypothetical protein
MNLLKKSLEMKRDIYKKVYKINYTGGELKGKTCDDKFNNLFVDYNKSNQRLSKLTEKEFNKKLDVKEMSESSFELKKKCPELKSKVERNMSFLPKKRRAILKRIRKNKNKNDKIFAYADKLEADRKKKEEEQKRKDELKRKEEANKKEAATKKKKEEAKKKEEIKRKEEAAKKKKEEEAKKKEAIKRKEEDKKKKEEAKKKKEEDDRIRKRKEKEEEEKRLSKKCNEKLRFIGNTIKGHFKTGIRKKRDKKSQDKLVKDLKNGLNDILKGKDCKGIKGTKLDTTQQSVKKINNDIEKLNKQEVVKQSTKAELQKILESYDKYLNYLKDMLKKPLILLELKKKGMKEMDKNIKMKEKSYNDWEKDAFDLKTKERKTIKNIKKKQLELKRMKDKMPGLIKAKEKERCYKKHKEIFLKPEKLKGKQLIELDIKSLSSSSNELKKECNTNKILKSMVDDSLKKIISKREKEMKKNKNTDCNNKFKKLFDKPSKLKGEEMLLIDIESQHGLLSSSEKLKEECKDPKFVKKVTTKFNSIQAKRKKEILKNKKKDCERKFDNIFKYPSKLKGDALNKLNIDSLSGSSEKLKTDCTSVKGFTNKVTKKFKLIESKRERGMLKAKKNKLPTDKECVKIYEDFYKENPGVTAKSTSRKDVKSARTANSLITYNAKELMKKSKCKKVYKREEVDKSGTKKKTKTVRWH